MNDLWIPTAGFTVICFFCFCMFMSISGGAVVRSLIGSVIMVLLLLLVLAAMAWNLYYFGRKF